MQQPQHAMASKGKYDYLRSKRFLVSGSDVPANTKHLYNIYTMMDQRLRRWANFHCQFCLKMIQIDTLQTFIKSGIPSNLYLFEFPKKNTISFHTEA